VLTPAEKQRRYRQRLRKAKLSRGHKAARERQLLKVADKYIPAPSGPTIVYWDKVRVQTPEGEREVYAPRERPWAAVRKELLSDDDIRGLFKDLRKEALRRSLEIPGLTG
jgi:hypothetical protein